MVASTSTEAKLSTCSKVLQTTNIHGVSECAERCFLSMDSCGVEHAKSGLMHCTANQCPRIYLLADKLSHSNMLPKAHDLPLQIQTAFQLEPLNNPLRLEALLES